MSATRCYHLYSTLSNFISRRSQAGMLNNMVIVLLLLFVGCRDSNQNGTKTSNEGISLYDLARIDLKAFAEKVAVNSKTSYEQTKSIVTWYAHNFDRTATDYKIRSIPEILERKGGNCNELALVATATMKVLGMKIRKVREINIPVENESRQDHAESKVAEYGLKASVFAGHHNDHVWIEIYDESSGSWFPADPSACTGFRYSGAISEFGATIQFNQKKLYLATSETNIILVRKIILKNTVGN
jgi:hypothetical protein